MGETGQLTRPAEGPKPGVASHGRNPEGHGRNKGGRPPGSRNKPKQLLPADIATQILLSMRKVIPEAHIKYIEGVIREGKAISTDAELDVLILLLSRNLIPVMVEETVPRTTPDGDPLPVEFRKDVTERLKVLNSLLSLKNQREKQAEPPDKKNTILEVIAGRGIDIGRIAILAERVPAPVARGIDGVERAADEARALPDSAPERPFEISSGEQVETNWVLDGDFRGDDTPGGNVQLLYGERHQYESEAGEGKD